DGIRDRRRADENRAAAAPTPVNPAAFPPSSQYAAMNVERIESADADDQRVSAYRDLRDGELLRARGLFVAEGRMVVRRLIEDGRYAVQSVLLNDAALNDLTPWLGRLHPSIPILVCRTTGFEQLTGFNIHRGCLALVRRPQPTPLTTVISAATLLVVLEG